jgi:hypothetical protein
MCRLLAEQSVQVLAQDWTQEVYRRLCAKTSPAAPQRLQHNTVDLGFGRCVKGAPCNEAWIRLHEFVMLYIAWMNGYRLNASDCDATGDETDAHVNVQCNV